MKKLFLVAVVALSMVCGDVMSDFEFGLIKKDDGEISLQEWEVLVAKDESLEPVEDRTGVNPFTNEKVIFSGEGKARFVVSGERVGSISLEGGKLLTTGVPKEKCEEIGEKLGARVEQDDRS